MTSFPKPVPINITSLFQSLYSLLNITHLLLINILPTAQ